jgi:Chitobiase/beta-hexosaminidase C-terminal domain
MRNRQLAWVGLSICVVLAGCHASDGTGIQHSLEVSRRGPSKADLGTRAPQDDGGSDEPPPSMWMRDAGETRDAGGAEAHDASVHADAAPVHQKPDASEPHVEQPDRSKTSDAGSTGADSSDAGSIDSGSTDAGPSDARPIDAGPIDSKDATAELPPESRTDGCPDDAPMPLTRVRVLAAAGQAANIVGARIQGSNSGPTTDFTDLATLSVAPMEGAFADIEVPNTVLYRYVRFYAPAGSQAGIAEVEFYNGRRKLGGAPLGTVSPDPARPFTLAFDGDATTYFDITAPGGGYVGLDIARGFVTAAVTFSPGTASAQAPVNVTLQTATSGATIRYTTDGSDPSDTDGLPYVSPLRLTSGRTTVRAIASSDCRFDSAITSATYAIASSAPVPRGRKSYHIGNSLTDTINAWLEPIADSTGVDHTYARWTIPGAPIKWLAEHQGEGFGEPAGAASFDTFVRSFAPIDDMSLQPYSDPDFEGQGGAAVSLIDTALRYSPDLQVWIYAQWQGQTQWQTSVFANGGGTAYPEYVVPATPASWEEGTRNALLYFEQFRSYVDARVTANTKPILIVPAGLALIELKRQIDQGLVPGFTSFFGSMFEDEEHLTQPAQYLVALVFYACLYRENPEGRVTFNGPLTAEQARIFQRIAWTTASGYAGSGIVQ